MCCLAQRADLAGGTIAVLNRRAILNSNSRRTSGTYTKAYTILLLYRCNFAKLAKYRCNTTKTGSPELPGYARRRALALTPTLNKIGSCGLHASRPPWLTPGGGALLARFVWSASAPLSLTSLHQALGVGRTHVHAVFSLLVNSSEKTQFTWAPTTRGERFVIEDHAPSKPGRGRGLTPYDFCTPASTGQNEHKKTATL